MARTAAPAQITTVAPLSEQRLHQGQNGAIFVGCGFLLAESHGSTSFTLLLGPGETRQVRPGEALWLINGVLVETASVAAEVIGARDARGQELLRRHMEWELRYTASQNGWPALRPEGRSLDLGIDLPAMVWEYAVPGPLEVLGHKVARLAYATVAIDDVVFVMSAPVRHGDDLAVVANAVRSSLATLKKTAQPTDLAALSAELKTTTGPWKGCPVGR